MPSDRIGLADEDHAVDLITSDVGVTLGTAYEDVIRQVASARRRVFNDPNTLDSTVDEYLEKVAEEIQQDFHDSHLDITWPECPLHQRHPLWLRDGYWICEQLDVRVARLGDLRARRDATGRYVILTDPDPAPAS